MAGVTTAAVLSAIAGAAAPPAGRSRIFGGLAGAAAGLGLGLASAVLGRSPRAPAAAAARAPRALPHLTLDVGEPPPAQWLVGTCRLAGQCIAYAEDRVGTGAIPANHPWIQPSLAPLLPRGYGIGQPFSTMWMAFALAENPVDWRGRLWIDGREMPAAATGSVDEIIAPDPTAFDARLAALRARRGALAKPYNVDLLADLNDSIAALEADRDGFLWEASPVRANAVVNIPPPSSITLHTCRVFLDTRREVLGAEAVSEADLHAKRVLDYLTSRADADVKGAADQLATWGDAWDGTADQCRRLSWCVVEMVAWRRPDPSASASYGELQPAWRGRPPRLELLLGGHAGSAYSDNPAAWIDWILRTRFGAAATDIDQMALAAARTACAESVVLPTVARGDAAQDKLVTSDDVLPLLFPGAVDADGALDPSLLPTAAAQDAALAHWNAEWAGAANARPRYSAHGLFTSDDLDDPDGLLSSLADAMAGWVAVSSDGWRIVAGGADAVRHALGADDLAGPVRIRLGADPDASANVVSAALAQSETADWKPLALPPVVDPALVAADGWAEHDAGTLPWQAVETCGMRLARIRLRRIAQGLREFEFPMASGGAGLPLADVGAADRLSLDIEGETVVCRVLEVRRGSAVSPPDVLAVEEPDATWADGHGLIGGSLVGRRTAAGIGTDPLSVRAAWSWRRLSRKARSVVTAVRPTRTDPLVVQSSPVHVGDAAAGPWPGPVAPGSAPPGADPGTSRRGGTGWVLDLRIDAGPDVRSVEIGAAIAGAGAWKHSREVAPGRSGQTLTLLQGSEPRVFAPGEATHATVVAVGCAGDAGQGERGAPWTARVPIPPGTSLVDVGDVGPYAPASGQALRWDATRGEWVPAAPVIVVSDLPDPAAHLEHTIAVLRPAGT